MKNIINHDTKVKRGLNLKENKFARNKNKYSEDMTELIDSFIDRPKLAMFLAIFLVICILVIIAIMLDLWDGVHTAKKTGKKVHSHKLRITIAKISEYFRFIAIGFLIDCIGIVFAFYIMPFVAVVFGVGLIAVEAKSMFEHASLRKSHTAELPDIARSIVNCKNIQDAMDIFELIAKKQDEAKEKYSNNTAHSEIIPT